MTHDILESDIELATKLLRSNQPVPEILNTLVHRGIDPGKAVKLLEDLREGKTVKPDLPLTPLHVIEPQPRPPGSGGHSGHSHSPRHSRRSERPRRRHRAWLWVCGTGILILLGALAAFRLMPREHGRTESPAAEDAPAAKPSAPAAVSRTNGGPAVLLLEIGPDGLRVGGKAIKRENALETITRALGAPSRTNQTDQAEKTVYAFDQHGLLVYSRAGAGDDHLVLDFKGLGGTNGTQTVFSGTLKLVDQRIQADTDADTLASIPALGLAKLGPDGGILRSRYSGLDLCFMYLENSKRLSMVQIDLR